MAQQNQTIAVFYENVKGLSISVSTLHHLLRKQQQQQNKTKQTKFRLPG